MNSFESLNLERIDEIGEKMEIHDSMQQKLQQMKVTHPNLYELWKNYLELKWKNYIKSVNKFNKVFEMSTGQNDIPKQLMLYYIAENSASVSTSASVPTSTPTSVPTLNIEPYDINDV
jgi:transketolase